MKNISFIIFAIFIALFLPVQAIRAQDSFTDLSTRLIRDVYAEKPTSEITKRISEASLDELSENLDTDSKKKTFWINIYNSYVILILRESPSLWEDRGDFFSKARINIAGEMLSFDQIEHGFLRRSKPKWTLGFIPNVFAPKIEKKMRVKKVDPRIHFALNCGAESCPPVRFYVLEKLDEQLDTAASYYLKKITEVDKEKNVAETTPLMQWFRGDFRSYDGPKGTLEKYNVISNPGQVSIKFRDYNWTKDLNNFQLE